MAEQIESPAKRLRTDSKTDEFDKTNPFTKGSESDEVELKFDTGESLYVSKFLLSLASNVFKRMFQSQFKESSSECVELTGKNDDAFLDMLLNMHPSFGKPISGDKAMDIYSLAHFYDIRSVLRSSGKVLKKQVVEILCENNSSPDPAIKWLCFAEKYDNLKLLSRAAERVSTFPITLICESDEYRKLSDANKNLILLYRLKRCDKGGMLYEKLPVEKYWEN